MLQDKDKILARELGKLGGPGACLAAKLLPNDIFELTITTTSSPEKALEAARIILSRAGEIIEDCRSDPNTPAVCAVIGSGFWSLNPAIVQVQVVSTAERVTKLLITGVAKEGLIKQHAGEQAAKTVAELLTGVLT